jgi:two-component system cell cycle sensor histidine kinase/response regulator CckA
MLKTKLLPGACVVIGHALFAVALSQALPYLGMRDQPLYLLLVPALLTALYYPRWVYLTMTVVNAIVAASAVMSLSYSNPEGSLQIVGWATATGYGVAELLHSMMSWRLRTEERLREASEALGRSEARFRSLVEHTPAITYSLTLGPDHALQYVSPQIEGLLGFSAKEWLDDPEAWRRCVHPEDLERVLAELATSAKEGRPFACEYRLTARDGRTVWVHDHHAVVRLGGGAADCIQGVWLDVTEEKRAEAARQESETRYGELFDNATDIVYAHDLEGSFTAWNRAGEQISGYSRDEVLGMKVSDVVASEFMELATTMTRRKLLHETDRTAYEVELVARDGRRVPMEVSSWVVYREEKPVAVQGFARDVTERKRLETELLHSQKLEAIGRLAGGVAHDFNNILSVILGYSALLQESRDQDPLVRDGLREIYESGQRAAGLTRQLLLFSRKQQLSPQRLDLNDVVGQMEKLLGRLIGEDVRLTTQLEDLPMPVLADPSQIEQVLLNLAVNARDAMPGGGSLTIRTRYVKVTGTSPPGVELGAGEYVALGVTDTGTGMDPETAAHIFEPFFTTKELGKGTGLGLATVYGIVQQCGGAIRLDTTPGAGTTFEIFLPLCDGKIALPSVIDDTPASGARMRTILLAEDEPSVRRLVAGILAQAGFNVLEADSGAMAIEVCRKYTGQIDLMLADVVMPGMSGVEAARRALDLLPDLKVLLMSGYTDDMIVTHGLPTADTTLINKPFAPGELTRTIRAVLRGDSTGASRADGEPDPNAEPDHGQETPAGGEG